MIENVIMYTDDRYIGKFKGYRISIVKHYNDDLYDYDISKNDENLKEENNQTFLNIDDAVNYCKNWVNENN